jgi:hypothetical protein
VITFANQEALDLVLQKERHEGRIAGLREAAAMAVPICGNFPDCGSEFCKGRQHASESINAYADRIAQLNPQSPDSGKG